MKEVWKDITNYEGLYQVSNLGRVKSLERIVLCRNGVLKPIKEKILVLNSDGLGYVSVALSKNSIVKITKVQYLVAFEFLGIKPNRKLKLVIDHIDNNKINNKSTNLQLITQRNNLSKDKKRGNSKYIGVFKTKEGKFTSAIKTSNIKTHLGTFINEYDAHLAYQNALSKL